MQPTPEAILEATLPNASFSSEVPGLQLAWDSTSLGNLKACARKYFYSNVMGYQPRDVSAHLTFGILYHGGHERFAHARAAGADYDSAVRSAVRWALQESWNYDLGRPWISDIPEKNRLTLVRSLVWYFEQFREDTLTALTLRNGKPAIELSFRYNLGRSAPDGSDYLVCGHFDGLFEFQDAPYVKDHKTTKSALSPYFFAQFSPHNQFSLYSVASKVVYEVPVKGIIVDAAQIGAGFTRFQRQLVPRTPAQDDEFLAQLHWWVGHAEDLALAQHWPMNETACGNYGGCPYRDICGRSPQVRDQWLAKSFTRRVWDPLQTRGDI